MIERARIIPIKKISILEEKLGSELPKDIRAGVAAYWNEQISHNPRMFNGPVFSVCDMASEEGVVSLRCYISDYAHYKYSETKELGQFSCRNLYAGCLIKSADDRYIVSLNGRGSEFNGKIQFIGGAIDPNDRNAESGNLDPIVAALRELEEEAGPEIRDSIYDVGDSFLITNGKKYGIQTVFESNMDSEAIIVAFGKYKAESGNDEIDKMISFEKKNMEDLSKYRERQDLGVVDLLMMCISGYWKYTRSTYYPERII